MFYNKNVKFSPSICFSEPSTTESIELDEEIILRQFCSECQMWRGEDILRAEQRVYSGES